MDDGVLSSDAPPKCWLRTADEFVNYVLRLEWRLVDPESNSGVFLSARDVAEEFPSSLEVQIYKKNAAAMFPIRNCRWSDGVRLGRPCARTRQTLTTILVIRRETQFASRMRIDRRHFLQGAIASTTALPLIDSSSAASTEANIRLACRMATWSGGGLSGAVVAKVGVTRSTLPSRLRGGTCLSKQRWGL